ncbi:MAG: DUF4339 domain-containing protein [Planctomycetota bacterium]
MTESIWYYARGESEQGPISSAQIKALAATGALRRDDLVWKEGMENWLPASDVDELFPQSNRKGKEPEKKTAPAAKENGTPVFKPAVKRPSLPPDLDMAQLIRSVGRGLVVFGVLIVLMSRGCDSLGVRKVARLQALSETAESTFQRDWDREKSDLQDAQELAKLNSKKTEEQQKLRQGKWADYKIAADDSESNNRMWAYWRQIGFLFGTMVLAVGLLFVTPTTEGPERWICLVMLTVILHSVYASNSVWSAMM